jgi:pantothenate kinase type III
MSLIAVDIGNSRIKLGLFAARAEANGLPTPSRILATPTMNWDEANVQNWLRDVPPDTAWWIASVNRPALSRLIAWIEQRSAPNPKIRRLAASDLPITAAVEFPDKVGIDRLAGAVAANRLRNPARPAIVIGVGSAITVDLVGADGVFRGGAILPGIGMSARALDEFASQDTPAEFFRSALNDPDPQVQHAAVLAAFRKFDKVPDEVINTAAHKFPSADCGRQGTKLAPAIRPLRYARLFSVLQWFLQVEFVACA